METNLASDIAATDLQGILGRLPVAAYICDADGRITYYNDKAAAVLGCRPSLTDKQDQFNGFFKSFFPDGTPIPRDGWMGLAARNETPRSGKEIVIEGEDGSRITALAHSSALYDASGRLTGTVNVLVDITDRKLSFDALKLADKRKDEFLAVLSHEMRTPLATVRNSVEVISHEETSVATQKAIEVMDRQIQQLVRLVDDLIDVSRITFGRIELRRDVVCLVASLEAAVDCSKSLIQSRAHEMVWDVPSEPVYLSADPARLAQIFTNLITNAAKYTTDSCEIRIAVRVQAGTVRIDITDNGIGIAPEMQDRIFENFAQIDPSMERSQGGLGIGLNVARQLAELQGGTLTVASEGLGKGSTFTVTLPTLAVGRVARGGGLIPWQASARRRVLVVDDDKDFTSMLAVMLEQFGHEVKTVNDGTEALGAVRSFRPQAVLLDVGMPRLNGFEAAKGIRADAAGKSVLLIALTGWSKQTVNKQCIEAGFDLQLVKPVEPSTLRAALGTVKHNRAVSS